MPRPQSVKNTMYAGFWRRLAASMVDGWIMFFVGIGISMVLGTNPFDYEATGTINTIDTVLTLAAAIGYAVIFWVHFGGATPGKKMFGIKISSLKGSSIGYPQAIIRYFGQWVSTIPVLLGYLWVIWDSKKQAWHDKIAQTVVVKTNTKSYGLAAFFVIFLSVVAWIIIYSVLITQEIQNRGGWSALETGTTAQEIYKSNQEAINSMDPEVRALYDQSQENFETMRTQRMEQAEYIAFSNKNIDTLIKATELAPENHVLWANLSSAYTWNNTRGTLEDSLAAIEKASELDPRNFTYVNNQADILMRLERYDEAVLVLEALGREINTDQYGYHHMSLGTAYMHLGITDKALEHLQKAEDIFSDRNEDGTYDQDLLSIRKMMAEIKNKQ